MGSNDARKNHHDGGLRPWAARRVLHEEAGDANRDVYKRNIMRVWEVADQDVAVVPVARVHKTQEPNCCLNGAEGG